MTPAAVSEADGVFQGGGIKGLAIVGAILGFREHASISIERWVNVAGTSAGAIIAAHIACSDDPRKVLDVVRSAPWQKFADYGPGGRILGGLPNLFRHHGLAHGEYFRRWFDEVLEGKTFRDVRAEAGEEEGPERAYRLKLIAADVTNRDMLVLPDDLPKYRLPGSADPIDPDDFKIADAVRMSLSIPFFFRPVMLIRADTGAPATIVDGGILSNFPVWLFDARDHEPRRPTFGLRLTGGRGVGAGLYKFVERLGWPAKLASDVHRTPAEAWDERFMSHSTVVRTCPVDAGDVGTTDFDLSAERISALLEGGRRDATAFLDRFDIGQYVNTFGRRLAEPVAGGGARG